MGVVTDRASWKIKDAAILPELLTLIELGADEAALLGSVQAHAKTAAPQMTAEFYRRLLAHPETSEYFAGKSMDHLHAMIGKWFIELFDGTYDEAYARRRMVIGEVHVRIGLPVRYPLSMIDVVIPFGEQVARQSSNPDRGVIAFRKVLSLDVAIFNQAYEDNQLKHLAELVGGERLARLLLAGAA